MTGELFVLSGPSGCGKTTLVRGVLPLLPDLHFSVSYTTRPQKKGEKEGVDYYFVTPEEFQKIHDEHGFLEHAKVHDHYYGTPWKEVLPFLEKGWDVLLDIDVQGAMQIRSTMPEAHQILILPPSFQELKKRLVERKREDLPEIRKRLRAAYEEIQHHPSYEYVIINDALPNAVESLKSIILSHRRKHKRMKRAILKILDTFKEEP